MQLDLYKSFLQYRFSHIIETCVGTIMTIGRHEQELHVKEFTLGQIKHLKQKLTEIENHLNSK